MVTRSIEESSFQAKYLILLPCKHSNFMLCYWLQDTAELFFDDIRLPSSAVLGEQAGINKGFYFLMQELPQERLEIGSMALASAEWMFEETRSYVKQRKAFRSTLSNLQVIGSFLQFTLEMIVYPYKLTSGTYFST